jgi:hypothetical protein
MNLNWDALALVFLIWVAVVETAVYSYRRLYHPREKLTPADRSYWQDMSYNSAVTATVLPVFLLGVVFKQ